MGSRSQYGPAAGAKGGPAPRLAAMDVPDFLRLDKGELHHLLALLRDPLLTHVYFVLVANSVFKTGEFLGTYARLMDLCTPPAPERGRRRPGPTYKQLRRVVDDLVRFKLARRGEFNESQGQLRLHLQPRSGNKPAPARSAGRV